MAAMPKLKTALGSKGGTSAAAAPVNLQQVSASGVSLSMNAFQALMTSRPEPKALPGGERLVGVDRTIVHRAGGYLHEVFQRRNLQELLAGLSMLTTNGDRSGGHASKSGGSAAMELG
jgi:hypothetical protein